MKKSFLIQYIPLLVLVSLCSCMAAKQASNPFYKTMNRYTNKNFPPTKKLGMYDLTQKNFQFFIKMGYKTIAQSRFASVPHSYKDAQSLGLDMGANIILYSQSYYGTQSGTNVYWQYSEGEKYLVTTQTTGSIGNVQYHSTAKSLVEGPGSFSYYAVPYTQKVYDHYAVFLVKPYWLTKDATLFDTPKLSEFSRVIKKDEEFYILRWTGANRGKYLTILINNEIKYLSDAELEKERIEVKGYNW